MSDMRRAARALVETHTERFESRHRTEEASRRLDMALAKLHGYGAVVFASRWEGSGQGSALIAQFAPPAKTQRLLKALSLGMALLIGASIWAVVSAEVSGSARFLLPMIAVLAILGFPFLVLGLASSRQSDEARIRKAIRIALLDEDEAFPPPQRWADED